MGRRRFLGRVSAGSCSDADGQAFITASGITNPTQQAAICQLVKDLKGVGSTTNNSNIWSYFNGIYPLVGGDATKHSFNLKNPSIYNVIWGGTALTHSPSGITSNGSGYGQLSGLNNSIANNGGVANEGGCGAWLNTDYITSAGGTIIIGSLISVGRGFHLRPARTATTARNMWGTNEITATGLSSGATSGFWLTNCISGSTQIIKDGTVLNSGAQGAVFTNSNDFVINGVNSYGSMSGLGDSGVTSSFYAVWNTGLTSNEVVDFQFAVNKFQTTLGRN